MQTVNSVINSITSAVSSVSIGGANGIIAKSTKPVVNKPSDRAWWKSAVVYQIYPASFADHAANGHGTLLGIKSKVPYLKSLGVDVVWMSPMYESPQADMGYDISNYEKPDPRYGTLEDWDALRDEVHANGMKLVMDLVINHTSEEHAWFKESRSSKDSSKRDWYIWRDAKIGPDGERQPPNNWRSAFGVGPAWTWDEGSQQYYLHTFLPEQPDLNWENPTMRRALWDMMHYWFKRGADGFRMDVINFTGKHPDLPDAPEVFPGRKTQPYGNLTINRPIVHEYLKEMNKEVLQHYDCFAVGECPGGETVEAFAPYSIPANNELQMVFHFHHQGFDRAHGGFGRGHKSDWKLTELKKVFNYWNVEMEKAGGWNSNYLENHDQPRTISRMASDHADDRAKSAKLLSMFQCSLTGTIFVYQGQEIGLCNVPRNWGEEEYKDIETIQNLAGEREWRKQNGKSEDMSDVMKEMRETARDNGRTPMQWDSSENAGFSKATPWMRVHDDYTSGWNVASQTSDPSSVFSFWQTMLATRKSYESLIYGKFIPLDETNEEVYAWLRDDETIGQKMLVVLNFAKGDDKRGKEVTWTVPESVDVSGAKLVISNGEAQVGDRLESREVKLDKWEGRIYAL